MMEAMGAAISGLEAQQTMLNTTASNLANVDTIGYKSQGTSFVDALSQTIAGGSSQTAQNAGTDPEQVGLGVSIGAIENNMSQGADQSTGIATDLAIQGQGFFQVANSTAQTGGSNAEQLTGGDGGPGAGGTNPVLTASSSPEVDATSISYTRAGNFKVSAQGYLVTQGGQYVLGQAGPASAAAVSSSSNTGAPIQIPTGATDVAISSTGQVTYSYNNTQYTAGYLQMATFNNNAGLSRDGDSLWSATTASGAASVATPGVGGIGALQSGELESSNVDMATEFANMIDAQNGYEADSKVITTANQMLQTLVQMPA
jgi:flagellar hook protein FlgE